MKLNKSTKHSNIPTIKANNETLTNPKDINNEFYSFYQTLYSSTIELNKAGCKKFLHDLRLTSLSQEESTNLNSKISLNELHAALNSMKQGKSPGWDGIPPEFCLTFWNDLGLLFLKMIWTSIEKGSFINDANQAIITLLPKPNKDQTLCSNYRPLSLLNTDVKLSVAKMHGAKTKTISLWSKTLLELDNLK
ncbi:hypothetical protein NQD34_018190 [Periophthalmus magnuspinnatus]|nr:hypothetical protein NQD34_018190 [Periophthalmus magnuspinnatus]